MTGGLICPDYTSMTRPLPLIDQSIGDRLEARGRFERIRMVLSKLCLPVAVSTFALGVVISTNSAKASNLLQCQGGDKKTVIACCMKSVRIFKPRWFINGGGSCSKVVSCGGSLMAIRRCCVEIPTPPTGSTPPPPPPSRVRTHKSAGQIRH